MTERPRTIRNAMLDLLAEAMKEVEDSDTIGYVVLSYDETPQAGRDQIHSVSVLGLFGTEIEAVAYADRHYNEVNRGVPEGSGDGWLTMVKPIIEAKP